MALEEYRKKRDFRRTDEPVGDTAKRRPSGSRLFVVQKHGATRLHYDVRLEHDGVLLSWAVPKGPSVDPDQRRLAVRVEDHPLEYADFEGVIAEGAYGGGPVLLWDRGTWEPEGDPDQDLRRGKLSFRLDGEKLIGRWSLIRMGSSEDPDGRNWLMIRSAPDSDSDPASTGPGRATAEEPVDTRPKSVATGRTLTEVAEDRDRILSESDSVEPPDPSVLSGARTAPIPGTPKPQLARRRAAPPSGDEWVHEVKLDGYRVLAIRKDGRLTLRTRGGNDWTARFPEVSEALTGLPAQAAVIDGEIVFVLDDGTTSFQGLQRALGTGSAKDGRIAYYAFDLLHLDGYDLRGVELLARKQALRRLLAAAGLVGDGSTNRAPGPVRYSEHIRGEGASFFRETCLLALEGAVSKRASSPYRAGRGPDWVKSKCVERQEFVAIGFTDPSGARSGFGSLLLGYHRSDGTLVYAGRVGTGFTNRTLGELAELLLEIERKVAPLDAERGAPVGEAGIHWVEPRIVVEVEFTEWTRNQVLRHPVFKGVREDLDPREVTRETPTNDGRSSPEKTQERRKTKSAKTKSTTRRKTTTKSRKGQGGVRVELEGIRLTHPDRVLYPEQGVTKRRLAEYYRDVGDHLLEYAADRPLTLVRCPKGRKEKCFYQKHVNESVPDAVPRVEIEESEGTARYLTLDSVASLVALVQIGTLEVHTWGSRIDRLERPDRIVFDLDPGSDVGWTRVVDGARELRERLGDLGLESFVNTTGGKGLHVIAPITRRHGWEEVKAFARAVAGEMAAQAPDQYVAKASKSARAGKIYIDWLRNARGATAVAPYSSRARPNAPVAVPLRWDELGPQLTSDHYTVDTILRRLAALENDPWEGFFDLRQSITHSAREDLDLSEGAS